MRRRNVFKEPDPMEELYKVKRALAKEFKAVDAVMEHVRSQPPAEEILARLEVKIAREKNKKEPKHKAGRRRKVSAHS